MGKITTISQQNDKKIVLSELRTWTTKSKQVKLASYVKSGKIQSHLKSFSKSATREEKNDLIHEIGNFWPLNQINSNFKIKEKALETIGNNFTECLQDLHQDIEEIENYSKLTKKRKRAEKAKTSKKSKSFVFEEAEESNGKFKICLITIIFEN